MALNVLGTELKHCSIEPLTGFFRDGCCNTNSEDIGMHTMCVQVTDEFLAFSKSVGNDLSTPVPEYSFDGLKKDVAILSFGHPGNFAQAAIRSLRTEGIDPAHFDLRFVKPIDEDLLHEAFSNYSKIVTVEDGTVVGGFGSAVLEFMNANGYKADVKILGIPDRLVEHGSPKELHRECAYDAEGIAAAVRELMKDTVNIASNVLG